MSPGNTPRPTAGDRVVVRHGKWAGRAGLLLRYVFNEDAPMTTPNPEVLLDKVGRRGARVVRVLVVDPEPQRVSIKVTPATPVPHDPRGSRGRHRWWLYAKCRGMDTEDFFPEVGSNVRGQKRVCRKCPVINECLADALRTNAIGVWGGTTDRERREMRRRLDPAS